MRIRRICRQSRIDGSNGGSESFAIAGNARGVSLRAGDVTNPASPAPLPRRRQLAKAETVKPLHHHLIQRLVDRERRRAREHVVGGVRRGQRAQPEHGKAGTTTFHGCSSYARAKGLEAVACSIGTSRDEFGDSHLAAGPAAACSVIEQPQPAMPLFNDQNPPCGRRACAVAASHSIQNEAARRRLSQQVATRAGHPRARQVKQSQLAEVAQASQSCVRHLRGIQPQNLQVFEPLQMRTAPIAHWRVVQVKRLQANKPAQAREACVGNLCAGAGDSAA